MKNVIKILIGMALGLMPIAHAKVVPFQEDAYAQQAPENLISLSEKAASGVDFSSDYEVIVPKKAGIEINPWNKFIGYNINPATHNPLLIINPEWFSQLPEDQQLFLLGRNFLLLKHGVTPTSFKIIQYSFIGLSLLLMLLIFCLLSKTILHDKKVWMRILASIILVILCEFIILDPLQIKLKQYFGKLHDQNIHEEVIQKISSRDAAIKALEAYGVSIKNEIKNGEMFFKPFENLFEQFAENLKK